MPTTRDNAMVIKWQLVVYSVVDAINYECAE